MTPEERRDTIALATTLTPRSEVLDSGRLQMLSATVRAIASGASQIVRRNASDSVAGRLPTWIRFTLNEPLDVERHEPRKSTRLPSTTVTMAAAISAVAKSPQPGFT